MRTLLTLVCAACMAATPSVAAEIPQPGGWFVDLTGRNFSYDTARGFAVSKDVAREGLVSVTRRAGREAIMWWEAGGYRPTVEIDGRVLVDGRDIDNVTRVSGFRMDREGSYVRLAIDKGPQAKVRLLQDGEVALTWPRLAVVSVLSYDRSRLVVANFAKDRQQTEFLAYPRGADGRIQDEAERIGVLDDCAMLSAKVVDAGIALQVHCDPDRGSDVYFLDGASGEVSPLLATRADEILAFELHREKGAIPVLTVDGSDSARQLHHAITGTLLSNLGEPMARASDEAGKLSWSQSYRVRVLGRLFKKTQHPVFADLAIGAMGDMLGSRNSLHGIDGSLNPACGWASRIYSTDRRTPVSFLINQAMIVSTLLQTSEDLGGRIPADLAAEIRDTAACLVEAYEPYFNDAVGLYRIPFGAPFRYDGVWAPWNWHMSWAPVLERVGEHASRPDLIVRAYAIVGRFTNTWTTGPEGALWNYWAPEYYSGWSADDRVSVHRPSQKPAAPRRREDINHAGISLLGIAGLRRPLDEALTHGVRRTLDRLLDEGSVLPRDLDGAGPRSPRWLPGAGWDAYATPAMRARYAGLMPGAVSSDQHLAYAELFDPAAPFELRMNLSVCRLSGCDARRDWRFDTIHAFLADNPRFTLRIAPDGHRRTVSREPNHNKKEF